TNINLYTELTLTLVYNLTNNDLVCGGEVEKTVSTIATPCVNGNIIPTSTTSFTASYFLQVVNQIITYTFETFTDVRCEPEDAVAETVLTVTNPTTNIINYSVSRLTEATTYYVKMTVAIGGNPATDCPNIQSITTL
ncbi:MAG: hypothetical protein ACOVOV_02745, partial [Dolichospermum sp.]